MSTGVAILGAGPAGLGAAFQLARRGLGPVTVLEQGATVGGTAGSFPIEGMRADFGSHRLHPACDARILADLKELLGDDLLLRPRHGRIRLQRRWIHFPLRPLDLALHLPGSFAAGVAADTLVKPWRRAEPGPATFASVLEAGLGPTICREFYFPYARKIWGLAPEDLSPIQARRRVSAGSPGKLMRKILAALSGVGRFYYPRQGFGQISTRLQAAARDGGASFLDHARVVRIERQGERVGRVFYERGGELESVAAGQVWSTLPVTLLLGCLDPAPPEAVLAAAAATRFRAMILIYLVLDQAQFSEYDAHYFPEAGIPITRVSEPKNYSAAATPADLTVLCAELPCDTESDAWRMSDSQLGELVRQSLAAAELPVRSNIRNVLTRRLPHAYPLYRAGYEKHWETVDHWLGRLDNLLTFGRQGLFAHDNTHHALSMAYSAVDCLDGELRFDRRRWHDCRRVFESHVVED
ncbi:MAG: FAD-dependent oxidoreductase [Acidobacteria bacterium]|nr:FAD-dependent oxidoreductase [Acidobacteriota bacterium]